MSASPQYIENMISVFSQAAEANRRTPGRQGNMIVLTPEMASDVMLTGDLHGHRRNFNLIRGIADLENFRHRHLLLQEVCHGGPTYPENGGCMSHTVLEDIARLKIRYPDRVHFMLGNHELAELADYPIQKNKQMLNVMFRLGMVQMYGEATDRVREAMLGFLRSCILAMRLPGGVFVCHSIPEGLDTREFDKAIFSREMDPLEFYERGEVFQMVWGRDHRPENAAAFASLIGAQVLIHGHEPCADGYGVPNSRQVILDCCGDNACYVILPTDREWTHAAVVERIARLSGAALADR